MKTGRLVVLSTLAGILACGLYGVSLAEQDIQERRTALSEAKQYWNCDVVPADEVLARVYAGRIIVEQHPEWKGPAWLLSYAAYTTYIQMRLGRTELAEAYLKTPTSRERGCAKVGSASQNGN